MKDFNYYKTWALNHLKKQLESEKAVKKALEFCELMLQKSFPVGTIREWKGKKYKKVAPGKWMRYYNSQSRGSSQALRYAIKQLEKINDIETLAKFVNANRSRFCDEHGKLLPEAEEIFKLGKEKAGGIKTAAEKEKYRQLQEEFKEEIRTGKRDNTKELQEDVNFWKGLIKEGVYSGEHLEHLKEIVKIGEAELRKRKKAEKKEKENTPKVADLELSDFPEVFSKGKRKKEMEVFLNFVNSRKNAIPLVKNIYKSLGKLFNNNINFKIVKTPKGKKSQFIVSYIKGNGKPVEQTLQIDNLGEEGEEFYTGTMLHELMHVIDFSTRKDKDKYFYNSGKNDKLNNIVAHIKPTKEEVQEAVDTWGIVKDELYPYQETCRAINRQINELSVQLRLKGITTEYYNEEYDRLSNLFDEQDLEISKIVGKHKAEGMYCDIYDTLTSGDLMSYGCPGHGFKYYLKESNKIEEIVANVASLSIIKPEYIEKLKKNQPELMNGIFEFFEEIEKEGSEK